MYLVGAGCILGTHLTVTVYEPGKNRVQTWYLPSAVLQYFVLISLSVSKIAHEPMGGFNLKLEILCTSSRWLLDCFKKFWANYTILTDL